MTWVPLAGPMRALLAPRSLPATVGGLFPPNHSRFVRNVVFSQIDHFEPLVDTLPRRRRYVGPIWEPCHPGGSEHDQWRNRLKRGLVYTVLASVMLELESFANSIFTPPPAGLARGGGDGGDGNHALRGRGKATLYSQLSRMRESSSDCAEAKCRGARNLGSLF